MFFGGVMAFTALVLGGGVLYQIIRTVIDYNADFMWVVKIFLLKLPEIVSYTLPMSVLFCVLLGFSRFSSDLEVTAFRAGGISFLRLQVPVLIFALVVSMLGLLLNDRIVPMANLEFEKLLEEVKVKGGETIKKENIEYTEYEDGKIKSHLFAGSVDSGRMKNVYYTQFEDEVVSKITLAEIAVYNNKYWQFFNGTQLLFNSAGDIKNVVKFEGMDIIFKQRLEDLAREKTRVGEYTYAQLKERINILEQQQHIDSASLKKLKVDLYGKLAIPFASFTFALIAAPLGLKPQRASSSVGFGISIIIIFFYYIMRALFRGLGQAFLDPALAAWLPNMVLITIGAWLSVKASR